MQPAPHARMQMGKPASLEVDLVIGADGANSRVAKDMDAGEYDYAIAFQVGHRPDQTIGAVTHEMCTVHVGAGSSP
jgi:geranylgeranyl diphosphate/geranylgeranyl-bacteriochlorophyllide a reductase